MKELPRHVGLRRLKCASAPRERAARVMRAVESIVLVDYEEERLMS